MFIEDGLKRIQTVMRVLREAGHTDAALMLDATTHKVRSAAFCIDSVSERHGGDVADRTHVECAFFLLKAALDASAEAINIRFGLGLVRRPLAASTGDLARSRTQVRNRLQAVGMQGLTDDIESVLDMDLYRDLKALRDRAAHRSFTRYAFTMAAGGGTDETHLKNPDGTDRPLPVQDDLRGFLQFTVNVVVSWAEQLR